MSPHGLKRWEHGKGYGEVVLWLTLTLTLTLILFLQPETTATFGSIHRLCHSNYDLSTPTRIRSFELAIKSPVIK